MKLPRKLQVLADEMGVDPLYVGNSLWVAVVTYTPDLSASILEHRNPSNRKLDNSHATYLGKAMQADRFPLTGQTAIFDADANVCDGQGRLTAVVWSKKSVPILTVFGVDRDRVFPVLDHGKRRSLRDVLFLSDREKRNITLLSGTITCLYEFFTTGMIEGKTTKRMGVTDAELLEFSRELDGNLDGIVASMASRLRCPALSTQGAAATALHWVFAQIDAASAEEMFVGMSQGAMPLDEPRWAGPRKFMQRMQKHTETGQVRRIIYSAFLIKAWNSFYRNADMDRLQWIPSHGEAYPQIAGIKYDASGKVTDPRFILIDAPR